MLISLYIENFTIVSRLELDFSQGMTAFTGETGAGKSILIDALMLALGDRTDVSVIRPEADRCDIHACFQVNPNSLPEQWLNEYDVVSEDGMIWLRRVIFREGRSKSYINAQPFPLQKVKELSGMLVDIHGQHQHQTLLQHTTHRQQLDQFADHQPLLDEVASLYRNVQTIKQALKSLQNAESSHERIQWLQCQLDELNGLNLKEGEIQALNEEHQLLHHARDYLEQAHQIKAMLNTDEVSTPVGQRLNQILRILASLPVEQAQIKNALELINGALIQSEEAFDEINRFIERVQLDPERLHEVEERISVLHQVARKHRLDAGQLPAYVLQLQNQLQQLQGSEHKQRELKEQYDQQVRAYEKAALALRQSRQKQAEKLAKKITQTIRQLGMPKGFLIIDISPLDKMQIHGFDKVEYRICTNPGMHPDVLGKIASGGELSRISLAIQMIVAQRASTPTLLFDEVDVGIGGATAALVGQLLRRLGERLQVFCVTHQPLIASCAHHHFVVEKYTENQQTFSKIISLADSEKVDEIARMLGGSTITEQSRSHARQLVKDLG